MSGLPPAFSYYINSLGSGIERSSVRLVADNGESAGSNSSITFTLPDNAVVDLNSIQFTAKISLKNAVGANTYVAVPQAHCLFRSVQWSLNGNVVSGQSNQSFGQTYEMLRRATTSEDDAFSRLSEYADVPVADSDGLFQASKGWVAGTGAGTGKYIQFNDFMGIQRSVNSGAWDCSVAGTTRLHLYLESDRIMAWGAEVAGQNVDWQLSNIELRIDVLRIPPEIDAIVAQRLASGASLDTCFPEYYAQISSADANVRCSVATNSLDAIMFAPLQPSYLNATRLTSDANGVVAGANQKYGADFCKFNLQTAGGADVAVGNETLKYNWTIGGKTLPASGATRVEQGLEYTKDCFSRGVGNHNLLYRGVLNNAGNANQLALSYSRENALRNNTIVAHKLCLTAPAHETAERTLTGQNTQGASSTISLQTQNFYNAGYLLIVAQTSAVMSMMAGQQVQVQY